MSAALARRTAAFAGLALLVAIVLLAATHRNLGRSSTAGLPTPVEWTTALAAPYGPSPTHERTSCGQLLTKNTLGVAHPVLPCGVKVFIAFRGHRVLTQVIDRGPRVPGLTFAITDALARKIGLSGRERISWAYAREPT